MNVSFIWNGTHLLGRLWDCENVRRVLNFISTRNLIRHRNRFLVEMKLSTGVQFLVYFIHELLYILIGGYLIHVLKHIIWLWIFWLQDLVPFTSSRCAGNKMSPSISSIAIISMQMIWYKCMEWWAVWRRRATFCSPPIDLIIVSL